MGSAVTIDVSGIEQLAKKLNGCALTAGQKEDLLKGLGMEAEDQTKARFDTETDPQGDPWKALTAKYARRKYQPAQNGERARGSSGGILVYSGDMRRSIGYRLSGGDAVLIGSPMEYADYHQNAKKITRRRQFLGLGEDDIKGLENAIDVFLGKHLA
jgi:phage gpG-like protein